MRRGGLLAAALLALLATSGPTPSRAAPTEGLVVAIESGTLALSTSRPDISVGKVVLSVLATRPDEVKVDGRPPADEWTVRELVALGDGRWQLPALRVEAPAGHAGIIAVSVKAWFVEVDNRDDGLYYARLDDRYALVSYATRADGPDWPRVRPRFSQNRAATLEAFRAALTRPLRIELNDRPLPEPGR